jgi:hypothetical protein
MNRRPCDPGGGALGLRFVMSGQHQQPVAIARGGKAAGELAALARLGPEIVGRVHLIAFVVAAGSLSNLMWIKWFPRPPGRIALAPARPAPYVADATHRETDAPAPRRLPPSLPSFPASGGFACDVA